MMDFKKTLLTSISAIALFIAAPAMTQAGDAVDDVKSNSDSNDQDIDIGSNNAGGNVGHGRNGKDICSPCEASLIFRRGGGGSGGSADGFDDHNAVAVAALQQNSVQVVASEDDDAIDDNYDAEMDFGRNAFRGQTLNNNNFNSGVNALQGNAMAIAGTADNSFGAGGS